jgi:hypothetical protein
VRLLYHRLSNQAKSHIIRKVARLGRGSYLTFLGEKDRRGYLLPRRFVVIERLNMKARVP